MANLASIKSRPQRIMIVGFPGRAKTGALAALANAGFKLRILDFDGNLDPLFAFCTPEGLANIDAVHLGDKTKLDPNGNLIADGIPSAFKRMGKMLDHWKYTDADGVEVDLGKSTEWGQDTIVVLDSLTSFGDNLMLRAAAALNARGVDDRVYGYAQRDQDGMISKMTSPENRFHLIVISHLTMIGPKDIRKGDSDIAQDIKRDMAEMMSTRYYPSAVGWKLPQFIGKHFPTIVQADVTPGGKLVLKTRPRSDLDLKVPALNIDKELDIGDGMLKLFKALGSNPPSKGETA